MILDLIKQFDQHSPGRRLSIIHRLSMIFLSGSLSQIGISSGKLPFLMNILCSEGIVQEDLTNYLCVDRAATARAVQHLEKDGLVYREEDQHDRRRKKVYPTEKAKHLQDDIVRILKNHNEVLFTGFSEEEQTVFMSMMDRIIENLHNNIGNKSAE